MMWERDLSPRERRLDNTVLISLGLQTAAYGIYPAPLYSGFFGVILFSGEQQITRLLSILAIEGRKECEQDCCLLMDPYIEAERGVH